jgi:hypothetical protein
MKYEYGELVELCGRYSQRTGRENFSQCHFVRHKSHVDRLALNPIRHGERQATNRQLAHVWAAPSFESDHYPSGFLVVFLISSTLSRPSLYVISVSF